MLKIKSMFERKKILPLVLTLANSIIDKLGLVEEINKSVSWDSTHWDVTPGDLAKMVVLSTFTDIRIALTHLADRFECMDVGFFVSEASKYGNINSFNAGRALERIGEIDYDRVYEKLAVSALCQYRIPVESLHADTTTISFYGEYDINMSDLSEEEKKEYLEIERGYNKDGRPECKQVVVGEIVNELGVPIAGKTMDGSTSDVTWNAQAIQYLKELQQEGFQYGVFVADSKLITHDLVTSMNDKENMIPFVSRCPANFEEKLEERTIQKAYEKNNWKDFGRLRSDKDAVSYRGQCFEEEVCGHQVRLLVLESSSLKAKAVQTLARRREELVGVTKTVEKKTFYCMADAEAELARLNNEQNMALHHCKCEIEKKVVEKWPRGRRGANTKPKITETFHVRLVGIEEKEDACRNFLERESCIVLISNAPKKYNSYDLFRVYKGQQVVENSFRELKHPSMASVIYLKNPQRIQALAMLLRFSLLVRAIIQFRLREGLRVYQQANPGKTLPVGWGNRSLEKPTYRLFYEHSINCYFERENQWDYSFTWPTVETKARVSVLLDLMGVTLEELVNCGPNPARDDMYQDVPTFHASLCKPHKHSPCD